MVEDGELVPLSSTRVGSKGLKSMEDRSMEDLFAARNLGQPVLGPFLPRLPHQENNLAERPGYAHWTDFYPGHLNKLQALGT